MTKNPTKINQFIDKSLGEWKSIRSTHTLAFQEFENSISKIYIKYINSKNKKVIEIFKNYKLSLNLESIAISIKWQAISDWEENDISKGDETILIFLPKDDNSGIVLRNKGYTESFISSSNYLLMNKIIYTLRLFINQQFPKKEFPFYPLISDPDFLLLEIWKITR